MKWPRRRRRPLLASLHAATVNALEAQIRALTAERDLANGRHRAVEDQFSRFREVVRSQAMLLEVQYGGRAEQRYTTHGQPVPIQLSSGDRVDLVVKLQQ